MAHRPVGSGFSTAIASGSATQSSAFSIHTDTLRLVAVSAGTHVAIGTNPTASVSDYYIAADSESTLSLSVASQKVAGITTGSTTIIDFPQGTGSPFEVGDYVSLTSVNQSYYNFTHAQVTSVEYTAGYDGYFTTRIVVDTNTSGIVTSFSSDGDLRKSIKVSTYGTGAGTLCIQQVQISGNA